MLRSCQRRRFRCSPCPLRRSCECICVHTYPLLKIKCLDVGTEVKIKCVSCSACREKNEGMCKYILRTPNPPWLALPVPAAETSVGFPRGQTASTVSKKAEGTGSFSSESSLNVSCQRACHTSFCLSYLFISAYLGGHAWHVSQHKCKCVCTLTLLRAVLGDTVRYIPSSHPHGHAASHHADYMVMDGTRL